MDEMEYPGLRFSMNAILDNLITPIKIDISTGDAITPSAVEYLYPLILEDRSITLWSYNLETILAEKLQTILFRGVLNTRMRDFYDIYVLLSLYEENIDDEILKRAFAETCRKRETSLLSLHASQILSTISRDKKVQTLWQFYQKKYTYASDINYEEIMKSVNALLKKLFVS